MPPSPQGRLFPSLVLALALGSASAAAAARIEVLSATGSVDSSARSLTGAEFSSETRADAFEPGDPPGALIEVGAQAVTRGLLARARNSLGASLLGTGFDIGGGSVTETELVLPADDPDGSATANALLSVRFRVDESFDYVVQGAVAASSTLAGDAVALVEISERGANTLLFDVRAVPEGPTRTPFEVRLPLLAGVEYELLAIADALADPGAAADSSFALTLRPIPEPGTALLLGLAVGALSAARRL